MADGGQKFFKICFSIIPVSEFEDSDDNEDEEKFFKKNTNQRSLYSEGGTVGGEKKCTSVQKLIILCIVPDILETYKNIKLLFDLTNINRMSFKFLADFKLILIVNGLQTASAMFPCPYCFISLSDMRKFEISDKYDTVNELRTYGSIKNDYNKFVSLNKDKKLAKNCHSTVNLPCFEENDDLLVLEKCVVPELHILLGYVNHLFWDGLVPLLGEETALLWPKRLSIVSNNYHGKNFEGNECRKLLKNADKLNDPEITQKVGNLRLVPYISAFKAMDRLVTSCFSAKKITADLDPILKEVRRAFLATEVSHTLKTHVLLQHVIPNLSILGNKTGLGLWSEQVGEAIHREFLKFWDRYKIKALDDPQYGPRLKKAAVAFSSQHI